jgi:hypothetical protein
MDILRQFLVQTPIWVWVILAWLVARGIKARRPGTTTLTKMATIPVVFTVWGLYDLVTAYGVTLEMAALWLLGVAAGSAIGWWIASRFDIVADHAAGVLHRPADMTLLPLLLATFAVKYGFGAAAAIAPHLAAEAGFRIADLTLCGLFTGIFVGKFLRYAWIWRKPATGEPIPHTQF